MHSNLESHNLKSNTHYRNKETGVHHIYELLLYEQSVQIFAIPFFPTVAIPNFCSLPYCSCDCLNFLFGGLFSVFV